MSAGKFERLSARVFLWFNKKPSSKKERYWSFVLPWFFWGVMAGSMSLAFATIFDRSGELSTSSMVFYGLLFVLFVGWITWVLITFGRKDRDDGYWDALHERHLVNWKQHTEDAKEKLGRRESQS